MSGNDVNFDLKNPDLTLFLKDKTTEFLVQFNKEGQFNKKISHYLCWF